MLQFSSFSVSVCFIKTISYNRNNIIITYYTFIFSFLCLDLDFSSGDKEDTVRKLKKLNLALSGLLVGYFMLPGEDA